jgi:predicted ribosomally synthesized peptide with SipW-like signal peptide
MKKILVSLMVIALVAGLVGAGLSAYFSDTETSTGNTFSAGTLDLVLSDNDETDQNGVSATWASPSNWAPGQTVTATLTLKNTGSQGARWVAIDPTNLAGTAGFGDQILVTDFTFTRTNNDANGWSTGNLANSMATWGIWGSTAPLTLAEFVDGVWSFMAWDGPGAYDDPSPGILLPASGSDTVLVTMTLQFDPNAGNEWQAASASFDLRVVTFNGPPSVYYEMGGGSSYGYGAQS